MRVSEKTVIGKERAENQVKQSSPPRKPGVASGPQRALRRASAADEPSSHSTVIGFTSKFRIQGRSASQNDNAAPLDCRFHTGGTVCLGHSIISCTSHSTR